MNTAFGNRLREELTKLFKGDHAAFYALLTRLFFPQAVLDADVQQALLDRRFIGFDGAVNPNVVDHLLQAQPSLITFALTFADEQQLRGKEYQQVERDDDDDAPTRNRLDRLFHEDRAAFYALLTRRINHERTISRKQELTLIDWGFIRQGKVDDTVRNLLVAAQPSLVDGGRLTFADEQLRARGVQWFDAFNHRARY